MAFSVVALLAGGIVAVNAATTSSATSTPGFFRHSFIQLTAAQKTALQAKMATRQQAMKAKQAAIKTAITNNDYSAWVTAEGSSSPLVAKITAANFPQYVQAYNLRQQANQIMTSLGLGGNQGLGFSGGHGRAGHGPMPAATGSVAQ